MSQDGSSEKADLTVEEIVSLLKRSSLPTIVVEGADDMIVYRRFEERMSNLGVSVLPVGGRQKVLEVFSRRGEIPSGLRIAFVADKDTWINTGVPYEFRATSLVLTSGYSIENDVFIDGRLMDLLSPEENRRFAVDLENFLDWYSLALARHLADSTYAIALHPDQVLDPAKRDELLALNDGEHYPSTLRQKIAANYGSLLRGKSLLALLMRNISYKGRKPRHTDKALLELVAIHPGELLEDLRGKLTALMSE